MESRNVPDFAILNLILSFILTIFWISYLETLEIKNEKHYHICGACHQSHVSTSCSFLHKSSLKIRIKIIPYLSIYSFHKKNCKVKIYCIFVIYRTVKKTQEKCFCLSKIFTLKWNFSLLLMIKLIKCIV